MSKRDISYRSLVKKETCALCGFVPVNPCQLDIHHVDGDRDNNTLSNLQVVCANCHRLITWQQAQEGHMVRLRAFNRSLARIGVDLDRLERKIKQ